MTTAEAPAAAPALLARVHDVLVVLLIAARPLCWDGEPGQPGDQLWQVMALGACALVALERAAGLRCAWAWSWRGTLALAAVLALLPAALGAPEPAPAWCRWSGWLACLAGGAYLAQVLPGRRALAWAALGGGLAVIAVLAVVQYAHVLPAMAEAQRAGAAAFAAIPGGGGALADRFVRGGAYATFTLANQLGAYLALAVPVVTGLAWSGRGAARWTAAGLVGLGLAALACTGAKGAWLALGAGAAVGWWVAFPGRWWRWLPLALAPLALAVALYKGFGHDSVAVRVGYWRAAGALVAEAPLAGHGLGGFGAHQPRVMRPGDEPTRFVHNEVLEAAVAGGVPVALLCAAALLALAWPRRAVAAEAVAPAPPYALWALAGLPLYLALLGVLNENLGWWPGGGEPIVLLGWAVLLGAVAAAVAALLVRCGPPPAWALAAGLAAVALKALIDFDLHAGGVLGSALLVAVAGGTPRLAGGAAGRWLPLTATVLVGGTIIAGLVTGLRLADGAGWLMQARLAGTPDGAAPLARQLGVAEQTPREVLAGLAALRAWPLADGAPGLRLAALDLLPPAPRTRGLAAELAAAAPHSAAIALRHAVELVHAREWSDAVAELDRALALAPTAPRVLDVAAGLLERIPGQAERARRLRVEAQQLDAEVHSGMRLRR